MLQNIAKYFLIDNCFSHLFTEIIRGFQVCVMLIFREKNKFWPSYDFLTIGAGNEDIQSKRKPSRQSFT